MTANNASLNKAQRLSWSQPTGRGQCDNAFSGFFLDQIPIFKGKKVPNTH